ncbi:MAG: hypothetical protein AAGD09_14755 [Cyanobacteria bacterium P01_F01_bin.56]
MAERIIRLGAALTASYLALGTAVIAHPPFPSPERLAPSAVQPFERLAQAETEPAPFEPLVVPEQFAMEVPTDWFTQASEIDGTTLISSYELATGAPDLTDIKTEIMVVAEPPDVYVSRELDVLIEEALAGAYEIDSYGIVSVGGNEALRIWLRQLPDEFAQQVITFIGDGRGSTARIVSFYNDDSPETKDLLLHMHGSFSFATAGE